jgi:hypothetical protein
VANKRGRFPLTSQNTLQVDLISLRSRDVRYSLKDIAYSLKDIAYTLKDIAYTLKDYRD